MLKSASIISGQLAANVEGQQHILILKQALQLWQGPRKPASEGAPDWGGAEESVIEPFAAALACIRSAHCPKWQVFGAMHSVGHGSAAWHHRELKILHRRATIRMLHLVSSMTSHRAISSTAHAQS